MSLFVFLFDCAFAKSSKVLLAVAGCLIFATAGCNPSSSSRQDITTENQESTAEPVESEMDPEPRAVAKVAVSVRKNDDDLRPLVTPHNGYIGSARCLECHPNQHASWSASYHRTMTQAVTPETVVGRFDGNEFEHYGWKFKPERDGDEYFLNVKGSKGGKEFRHKLVMATGSHHMQKYWYNAGAGRKMGLAPLVYLIDEDKWVPEHTAFLRPTEQGIPFREGSWNKGCNQCHATGSQPKLVSATEMNTQVAEFGISCEACHGPGEQHVTDESADSIVNPRKLEPHLGAQVCGQCHGGWVMINDGGKDWSDTGHIYRPGDDLHATRHYIRGKADEHLMEAVKAENSFWPDGQMRVAGREYNGLIASPCFNHEDADRRMTCLSCHDLHANLDRVDAKVWADDQMASGMRSNEACFQCHNEYRKNLTEHTKHSTSSAGSLCYNCHMPYTSYGLMKAVRSHTITSPSVAESKVGRPNACNQCHLDKTLTWTAENLKSQYGMESPELSEEESKIAASVLWTLKGDAGQRALMAWSFGWESARETSDSKWMVFYLTDLMFDDYDAVRNIAYKSLRSYSGYESLKFDYMKAESERDRAMDEVMAIWSKSPGEKPMNPELLFDQTGNLRYDAYQFLRAKRDKSRVVITE